MTINYIITTQLIIYYLLILILINFNKLGVVLISYRIHIDTHYISQYRIDIGSIKNLVYRPPLTYSSAVTFAEARLDIKARGWQRA